jgi:hypothetical protein
LILRFPGKIVRAALLDAARSKSTSPLSEPTDGNNESMEVAGTRGDGATQDGRENFRSLENTRTAPSSPWNTMPPVVSPTPSRTPSPPKNQDERYGDDEQAPPQTPPTPVELELGAKNGSSTTVRRVSETTESVESEPTVSVRSNEPLPALFPYPVYCLDSHWQTKMRLNTAFVFWLLCIILRHHNRLLCYE